MKKIILLLLFVIVSFQGFSQTPGISYQAVILNPNTKELPGANIQTSILANRKVAIRFTIINDSNNQEYQEYHQTKTDAYGMINLLIGHGIRIGSSYFEDIIWNGLSKKLKVEIDFYGTGNNYTFLNEQELTFMPQPALGHDSQAILDNKSSVLAEVLRATNAESMIQSDVDANEAAIQTALDFKVDKVLGKGLSTEDYTTTEKIKLGEIMGTNTGDQDISGIAVNSSNIGDITNLTTTNNSSLVAAINDIEINKADLESPSFSGTPLAPTATTGSNTTQIATTAFVTNAISTAATPDATTLVKGKIQLAGDLTGTAALPLIADEAVTSAKIADGAIVNSDIKATAAIDYSKLNLTNSIITSDVTDGAITSAKIATSPSFTGIPLAPTATAGTNTTQIATTAFVKSEISTATASNGNYVTLNSAQTITGLKTFATRKINVFAQSYALTATMNIGFAPNGENLNSIAMGINALYTHHYGARAIGIGNEALYKD